MATALDPDTLLCSTAEKDNFVRVTRLLISGGTCLLRQIFDQCCPPSQLPTILSSPAIEKQLKAAKLTKPQWDCLYPSTGVYGTSTDFDLTLLFRLLRTICNLVPPPTGWDVLPAKTELSLAADLVRIKFFRNLVYGHVRQDMEITRDEFLLLWQDISETLIRIAGYIGPAEKTKWQIATENFLKDSLTKEAERCVQELKRWYENDIEVKKSLEDIKDQLEELHQAMIGRLSSSAATCDSCGVHLPIRIDCEVFAEPGIQLDIPSAQEVLNLIAFRYFKSVEPSNPEEFNGYLQYLKEVRKVLVISTQPGSLIITVECSCLQILEELWEDYRTGHLNEMAQKFLVTKEILEAFGLAEVKLTTTIVEDEYRDCLKYFLKLSGVKLGIASTVGQGEHTTEREEPDNLEEPEADKPAESNKSEEPNKTGEPDKPEEPDKPGEPDKSAESNKSGEPDKPEEPDKLEKLGRELQNVGHELYSFEDNPPWTSGRERFVKKAVASAAVGVAACAAGVVAAPLIAGAALGAAGFTSAGVAAGSIAAAVQSSIGSVAAGSFFAACQSAAATGVIGSAATAGIGAGSGLTGIAATLGGLRLFGRGSDTFKLLICGSGDRAHVFAGIASSIKDTEVRVLSLFEDEAARWSTAMQKEDLEVIFHQKENEPSRTASKPALVTKNPEDAMRDVDMVVFMLRPSSHQVYLEALKPHIKPGAIIVGLPGHPGFEFQVRHVLGDTGHQCSIMNFVSLPWSCRITEFGVKCEVLGTKETLLGAIKTGNVPPKNDPIATLQYLLGPLPKLIVSGHPLGVQLMSVNAYLHTSILYGQWEGWDGKPFDEAPLFYNGLTESTANLLSDMSEEIVNIAKSLKLKTGADMSEVMHIYEWFIRCYPEDISDKTNLYTAIQTNAAYQGLKHPVKKTDDGKFLPDFTYRYMTEDIPYGLVVIRGIAEIVGVETPNIDKVLTWCQEKMGKEYLVNSKLQGKDIATTRAPQRYGFTTLKSIL